MLSLKSNDPGPTVQLCYLCMMGPWVSVFPSEKWNNNACLPHRGAARGLGTLDESGIRNPTNPSRQLPVCFPRDGDRVAVCVRGGVKGISLIWVQWCRKGKEESEILKLPPNFLCCLEAVSLRIFDT